MSLDDKFLSVTEKIYDAVADEALWPAALHALIDVTDSQAATFCVLDPTERSLLPTLITANFDPAMIAEYLEHTVAMDPTVQHIVANPAQKLVHDGRILSERDKDRSEYYDWHSRFSDTRHRMVYIPEVEPGIQAGVALHRTKRHGDFEAGGLAAFQALFGHIERALQIGCRLGTLGTQARMSLDLLDANKTALIFLDKMGRVLFANRAAEILAASNEGVTMSLQGLGLQRAGDDRRLQQLIAHAIAVGSVAETGTLSALRPSGKRPFAITVSPLTATGFAMTAIRPAVCVAIADPDAEAVLPAQHLRALFGLTPSEASLAERLATGDDLREAAAHLGIAYATARTQLAAVFRKTETRRQGELVKVLLATAPQGQRI